MLVTIRPAPGGIGGVIAAPPSKSMAHRAVLCAALAVGRSHITHLEFSKDISATLSAAAQLCAAVDTGADDAAVQGLGRFLPLTAPVDCCESGSTLRFLIPIASLTGQPVTFTGRGRLMERPQSVYETLYREQNLRFEQSSAGLTVEGALTPGDYRLAGNVSSQFISGLLFAHSRWLDETTLLLPGGQQYHPCDYNVEGDYSQAAFPAVLGAVCGGVTITGLAPDTLQGDAAILDILRRCGAVFTRKGDSVTFAKAPLHGVDIDLADCPDLGPVLMVLGLLCEGTTVIRNAERHRGYGGRAACLRRRAGKRRRHHHGARLCGVSARPCRAPARPQRPPGCHEPCGAGCRRRAAPDRGRCRSHPEELARLFCRCSAAWRGGRRCLIKQNVIS